SLSGRPYSSSCHMWDEQTQVRTNFTAIVGKFVRTGKRDSARGALKRADQLARAVDRGFERRDRSIELLLVHGFQDLADARARADAQLEHVPSEQNRFRRSFVRADRARAIEEPVHRGAVERPWIAAEAVGLREARQQLEIHFLRQPAKRAVADVV